jgi:hypothetical protein
MLPVVGDRCSRSASLDRIDILVTQLNPITRYNHRARVASTASFVSIGYMRQDQ